MDHISHFLYATVALCFPRPLSDSEVISSPLRKFYSQPDAAHILKVAPVANITAAYHKFTW